MSESGQNEQTSASLSERQRQDQAERIAIVDTGTGKRRKRGRKRLIASGVLLVLLGVVVFLPQIVGVLGKGTIESKASEAIGADVHIERLGLSWFGSQKIRSLHIVDGSLREAADVDVRIERSLASLIMNWRDLGRIVVSGSVSLDRTEGPLADLMGRQDEEAEPSDGPARLPSGLKAELVFEDLDLRYVDGDGRDVLASGITGTAGFGVGDPVLIDLAAKLASAGGDASELSIEAEITGLTSAAGEITLDRMTASGEILSHGEQSPLVLLLGRELGLGATDMALKFEGTPERGEVGIEHASTGLQLDLPASYSLAQGTYRIQVQRNAAATVSADVLTALVPEYGELAGSDVVLESGRVVSLTQVPGAELAIAELGIDIATDGAIDLNTLVVRMTLQTGEIVGRLDDEGWMVEPLTLELTTRGVERGVEAQAVTTAQLGGQPAGVFVLNARAERLFDASGAIPAGGDAFVERLVAGLVGNLEINNVETVLAESVLGPVVRRAGIVLEEDLGGTVDLEVSLGGSDRRQGRLWLTSDNLQLSAGLVLEEGVLRSDGSGVRAEAKSLASLISRQIDLEHVRLNTGGETELWIRDLAIDLDRFSAEGGADLRAISGVMEFRVGPMQGEIVDQGETKSLSTTAAALTVDVSDLVAGASVAAATALRVDSKPAGELNLSLRASDLVDGKGRLVPGVPTLDGELTLRGVLTSLAQPLVASSRLVLREDIGPSLDVIAQATVGSDNVVRVEGTVQAERLKGSANFEIEDRVLRSVDEGVSLEVLRAGEVLARLMGEGVNAPQGGGVRLTSSDLVIAGGDEGIDWSRSRVSAGVTVLGAAVTDAQSRQYKVERLDAEVSFGSGADGVVSLNGVILRTGEPVLVAGQMTLHDLIDGAKLSPEKIRLGGQFDVTGFPIAAATNALDMGERDVQTLAAELVGRLIDVSLVAEAESGGIEVTLKGDRLSGSTTATMIGGDLRVHSGRFESVVSEEVIEQIRIRAAQAAGKTEPVGLRFTEPARTELTFGGFGLLSGWALDPSGTADVKLTASGQVEGLQLLRDEVVVDSGAIGLEELTIEGRVPVGSIAGGESAQASLAIAGNLVSGESALGTIVGGLDVSFEDGLPSGPVRGDVVIEQVDSGLVDEVLRLDGLVAGVTGASISMQVEVSGTMAEAKFVDLEGSLALTSPRLSTESPARIVVDETSVRLREPVRIDWLVETDIATHRIFLQPVGAERVLATEAVDTVFQIDELVLARSAGIFQPEIFRIDASYDAPTFTARVAHESGDEASGIDHTYLDNKLRIVGDAQVLEITGVANPADGRSDPVRLNGTLRNFADAAGKPLWENATANIELDVKDAPTALYDALLRQGGMMAEVLGPEITLEIDGQELTKESGQLTLSLEATRASGGLVGRMFEGRFIATKPAQLVVNVVRPELGAYLTQAVPVIGTVSKSPEDGPATFTLQTLEVPLFRDSEISRLQQLSLEAVIDLGKARFQTSSLFEGVMKAAKQRSEGGLGRRMEPIEITVNSGNVTYPRTKIPFGEFTIESEGRYNLVTGDMDIVTYIPFAALSEEALGKLKTGLTSALGRYVPIFEAATMVPWRTKGQPGNRRTAPDIELLLKNLGDVLNPLNLINQGLGSVQNIFIDKEEAKEGG